jgi:hypothetical protein
MMARKLKDLKKAKAEKRTLREVRLQLKDQNPIEVGQPKARLQIREPKASNNSTHPPKPSSQHVYGNYEKRVNAT